MKTVGTLSSKVRKYGRKVLRRFPKTRLKVRHIYWDWQRRRYDRIAASTETDPHMVVFETFAGRSYADSPKAIYKAMCRDHRFDDWTLVWVFKHPDEKMELLGDELDRAVCVKRGSKEYFDTMARAGTLILNSRLPEYIYPKPDQTYVATWHGTPLKRLGYDVEIDMQNAFNTTSELAERFGMDAEKWSYLLSPSPYTSEHLSSAFGLPEGRRGDVVLEYGYPRNDVLAHADGEAIEAARVRMLDMYDVDVPRDKKVLLYAPTWRDNAYDGGYYNLDDVMMSFDALRDALGEHADEWVVLFRAHYYVADRFDFESYDGWVLDGSKVDDVNDCYLVSDVICTDYSSVFYDYAVLHRPILLFAKDIEDYADNVRGFYTDMSEIPADMESDEAAIARYMIDPDKYWDEYGERYERFVKDYCPHEDGRSSERVIETVFAGK